jgi:hypothetical protein
MFPPVLRRWIYCKWKAEATITAELSKVNARQKDCEYP